MRLSSNALRRAKARRERRLDQPLQQLAGEPRAPPPVAGLGGAPSQLHGRGDVPTAPFALNERDAHTLDDVALLAEGDRAATTRDDSELLRDVSLTTSGRKLASKGWKAAPVVSD